MSTFKAIKNFINSNENFTREDLIGLGYSMSTIDTYRRKLAGGGFITTEKDGSYKRVKLIPEDYSTTRLNRDYENRNNTIKEPELSKEKMEEIAKIELNKIKRNIKKIKRNHKLYFRQSNGILRRLDKVSRTLYDLIIVSFLQGSSSKLYELLNKKVKKWDEYKAIPISVPLVHKLEFKKLQKIQGGGSERITISYNGSWKPLVDLSLESKEAVKLEVVK